MRRETGEAGLAWIEDQLIVAAKQLLAGPVVAHGGVLGANVAPQPPDAPPHAFEEFVAAGELKSPAS